MGPQPARERVSIEELYPKLGELRSLIIGDPDSDEHRLAYAALWREVEGLDPERAELIERQIAMEQFTPLGRDWLLLANRCQELLLNKRDVWAPRWSRGSLERWKEVCHDHAATSCRLAGGAWPE